MNWNRLRSALTRGARLSDDRRDVPERRGLVITVCVCISVLVWFIFKLQERYVNELVVPTEIVNLPPGEALRSLPPRNVRMRVEGEGSQLLVLRFDPPTIRLNAAVETIDLAEQTRPQLPGSVRLESVSPQEIVLQKEERVQKRVPIRLRADITTPRAYALVEPPSIEPDSVTVGAAASIIEDLASWPTEPVTYANLIDTLTMVVDLADSLSDLVSLSQPATVLRAVSSPFTSAVRRIPVQVEGAPTSEDLISLTPSVVEVEYSVLLSDYEESQEAPNFLVTVSYEEIRSDSTGRIAPQLILPSDLVIRNARLNPPTLRYYNIMNNE